MEDTTLGLLGAQTSPSSFANTKPGWMRPWATLPLLNLAALPAEEDGTRWSLRSFQPKLCYNLGTPSLFRLPGLSQTSGTKSPPVHWILAQWIPPAVSKRHSQRSMKGIPTWEERRRRNPTAFSPCEVYETAVLLVFSAQVPYHTWFTYNPLTDSETNMFHCYRITKEGSIPCCQFLRFISDWLVGITSCLPRVKPVNKTTSLKTTARCQRLLRDCSVNKDLGNNWAVPGGGAPTSGTERDGQNNIPRSH